MIKRFSFCVFGGSILLYEISCAYLITVITLYKNWFVNQDVLAMTLFQGGIKQL